MSGIDPPRLAPPEADKGGASHPSRGGDKKAGPKPDFKFPNLKSQISNLY
jgi:hypothetical protein